MAKSSINKVRNLKQANEVWEVTVQPANTWIKSDHGKAPYRPWHVIVMSQNDRVVRQDMFPQKPSTHEIVESVFKGMRRPALGAGKKRRPSKILVKDEILFKEFAPQLQEIDIVCQKQNSLPYSTSLIQELNTRLNQDGDEMYEKTYSLTALPGVTIPLLGRLFEAITAFYHLAPWEMLPREEFGIEIRYPETADPRYAIVIGRAGESFGLSVNDTFDELSQFTKEAQENNFSSGGYSVLSFTYEQAHYLTFRDLDAIEQYGWEVPNKNLHPSILRYSPSQSEDLLPPNKEDIFWLAGVIPALVHFFEKEFDAEEFFLRFDTHIYETTIEVETLSGKENVSLKLPVKVY